MSLSHAEDLRVATAYGIDQLFMVAKLRIIFEITKSLVSLFNMLKMIGMTVFLVF